MPIVFVPLWIIFVLVERNKKVALTPEQEVTSADEGIELPTPTEIVSSAAGLTFLGVLSIVGGAAPVTLVLMCWAGPTALAVALRT
jgi:hypothetical protein